jgi:beta-phosphoglucomutase-like phosphatase (HAD superfamily)
MNNLREYIQAVTKKHHIISSDRAGYLKRQDSQMQPVIMKTLGDLNGNINSQWNTKNHPLAVLLDWDDHLIDSKEYYRQAGEYVISRMIEEYDVEQPLKLYQDRGRQKSSEYYKEVFGTEMARIAIDLHQSYLLNPPILPQLKPGAKELLNYLKMHDIPCAIVSDTVQDRLDNNATKTLTANGIDVPILVGTSAFIAKKPNPTAVYKALELLSEKFGYDISPSKDILISGDRPDKDGLLAENANISHVIIPDHNSGDVSQWLAFQNLETLTQRLASIIGKDVIKPNYFKRFSYVENNIDREKTEIIKGDIDYIESPATDDPEDGITLTEDEKAFHNERWIAKRGKNLDGSGNYSPEEKLKSGLYVVQTLLTDDMINRIADKAYAAAKEKREKGYPESETIIIHLPHIGGSQNMLRIGMLHVLQEKLNEIFDHKYPDLNVSFKDASDRTSPIFNVLSIAESLAQYDIDDIKPLSGHDAQASLTIKRSTGNLMERMAKQAIFNFKNFQPGDLVILADDHVQTGSTFITLYQQLVEAGVQIVALTSLATMPESTNLQAHQDVLNDLQVATDYAITNYVEDFPSETEYNIRPIFEEAANASLSIVGLSKESLSNREALTLMATMIEGTKEDQIEWFKGVMDKYGCDSSVPERKGDSIIYQAQQKFKTPVQIRDSIDKLIPRFIVPSV